MKFDDSTLTSATLVNFLVHCDIAATIAYESTRNSSNSKDIHDKEL